MQHTCWPPKTDVSQDQDMSTLHLPRCNSNLTFTLHAMYYIYRNATYSRRRKHRTVYEATIALFQKRRTVYKAAIALFCNVATSHSLPGCYSTVLQYCTVHQAAIALYNDIHFIPHDYYALWHCYNTAQGSLHPVSTPDCRKPIALPPCHHSTRRSLD